MFSLNPYALIGGGGIVLAVAGSMYIQSMMVHKYHVAYNQDEVTIGVLKSQIKGMTDAQNTQTGKSEQNVIRVVQGPKEVTQIIREIQDAPSKPCVAPTYPEEVTNAF